jgi:hypothetical protein
LKRSRAFESGYAERRESNSKGVFKKQDAVDVACESGNGELEGKDVTVAHKRKRGWPVT